MKHCHLSFSKYVHPYYPPISVHGYSCWSYFKHLLNHFTALASSDLQDTAVFPAVPGPPPHYLLDLVQVIEVHPYLQVLVVSLYQVHRGAPSRGRNRDIRQHFRSYGKLANSLDARTMTICTQLV
jgi:hypothetical protein